MLYFVIKKRKFQTNPKYENANSNGNSMGKTEIPNLVKFMYKLKLSSLHINLK